MMYQVKRLGKAVARYLIILAIASCYLKIYRKDYFMEIKLKLIYIKVDFRNKKVVIRLEINLAR